MTAISTRMFYDRASHDMARLRNMAQDFQGQIATGKRLGRSSDDPVAAAQLRQLSRQQSLSAADQRISDRVKGDLALADTALASAVLLVQRGRDLAQQAANGTLNADGRQAIATEISELRNSLFALANSRNTAGQGLFSGTATGPAYHGDASGAIQYSGAADQAPVTLDGSWEVSSGLAGPQIFSFPHDGATTDMFAVLGELSASLEDATADPVASGQSALALLDTGLSRITLARTRLGERLDRLEMMDRRRDDQAVIHATRMSDIGDADIAETITRLQHTMTVLEASQASFSRLAGMNLFAMLR
ncbi:MAG: flagellar hook-associated protein FlgL [Sphingomonadaceae bacterium]